MAPSAAALNSCGSTGQPACREDAPPNKTLTLTAGQNPTHMQPLGATLSASQPLWPKVGPHKPYGMNAVSRGRDGTTLADEVMIVRELGASMARVTADWAMIQYFPSSDRALGKSWNYEAYLDPIYKAYVEAGIRPLLVLSRAPRRFTSVADTPANSYSIGCGTSDACWNPPRADQLGRLKTFATDLAKRYPLAAGIEVWNEPNLSFPFWGGEDPDPQHYTSMLTTVNGAVKKARPKMPVIGGALANVPWAGEYYGYERAATRSYLAGMLRRRGVGPDGRGELPPVHQLPDHGVRSRQPGHSAPLADVALGHDGLGRLRRRPACPSMIASSSPS